jgi:subtilisin family serine protease
LGIHIHGRVLAACVTAMSIGIALSAQQANPQGRGQAPIRMKAAEFIPGRGEQPRIPPGLAIAGYAAGERGYFIVQFEGPILEAWKADVRATGAELLDYIPEFAYKVRMNPAQAAQVARLDSVVWVGLFHPAYKIDRDVIRNGVRPYTVRIERGADAAATVAMIAATGAQILQRDGATITVGANSAQLDAIAHVLDVASVENLLIRKKNNEYGAGVIIGAGAANAHGYDGSSQTVAVADTGLGNGNPDAFIDIPTGRIASIFNWPGAAGSCFASITNDGAVDVDSGHGTHTTTSILGAGGPSGEGRGTAPAARLIFQAVENWATISSLCRSLYGYQNGYYLVGIPSDIRQLFQQAYDGGARVHSNSWGSDAAGAYTADSANADEFVWSHRDMTVTFSAGNAGTDANADGVIDTNSMGSPATAKNVISVGASENDRQGHWECDIALGYTGCNGQNQVFTYGFAWPSDYPANPIKSDPSAGNSQQLAAFSSRGPASDGRIKPDVVAPGTWILSGYSDKFQQGYDPSPNGQTGAYQYDGWGAPLNKYYKYMGGTSMSNPIVAGGAAVIRDFYQKTSAHNASAALVKATLVNTAVDLLDENNDGINDNINPIPNVHEGWGLVDLAAATTGGREFFDGPTGLLTNSSSTYNFTVSSSGSPLKATLAWSDYPSTASALRNLVNDLDLIVTAPDGTIYLGNVFAGGWSQPNGTADRINNLENVFVNAAAAGSWTISVRGYNVPNGPQPFALVVNAAFGTPPAPLPPSPPAALAAAPVSASRIDLTWTDGSDNEDGFQIERCQMSGCSGFAVVGQVGPNVTSFSDPGLSAGLTYAYRVSAFNRGGSSAYSNSVEATTPAGPQPPAAPTKLGVTSTSASEIRLSWIDNSSDETGFDVERCQGAGCTNFSRIAQTAAGAVSYVDTGRPSNTTFGYRVRAVNAAGGSAYSNTVFPTTQAAPRSHIGDLDGSTTSTGNNWRATITILVHNDSETPLSGATVAGNWTGGDSGSASCTTNAAGVCTVTTSQMKRNTQPSVTFTVSNITHSTLLYNGASNHDATGNSNGTTITVPKP